ncbi:hypothetical protein CRM22_000595 [Opisthorchis felineus]|uniref:NADPH--hemoprotein reductase n=2 Tax=Opisthorchis felineus TaxID=147828 RepID=A0A4S2MEM7_OPIFE|nr:hypothetical protein CRM22_000595 [Opisthorchis felineus]
MVNLSLVDLVCCFLAVLLFFYVRFKRGALVISARRSPEATRLRTSNIKTFMEGVIQHNTRLFLFYGSQTGTAEHLAIGLHSFFFYQGLCPLLLNIAACDMAELNKLARAPNLLAIFILATHGHGEPTDDAREFVEHLRQRTTKLTELHFAVFGLGNSAYEQFNACAILVDRLLRRLGGIRLIEVGLGDELNNMEGTFLTWQASLLEAITQNCLVPDGKLQTFTNPMRRVYKPAPLQSKYTKLFTGEPYSLGSYERQTKPFGAKNPFLARVQVNRELHTGGTRSCRHIELDISGGDFHYKPGDHVAILPRNPDTLVLRFSELLDIDLNQVVNLECVDERNPRTHPFPCPCTYRTALTHYVDLSGPPRLQLLTILSAHATDAEHARQLRYLGSNTPESNEYYSHWVLEERRNVVDVIVEFPSVRISVDYLLELLPRIKPRFYSISSSPLRDSNRLHLTVAIVAEQTPNGSTFKGLTTQWLEALVPGKSADRSKGSPILLPIYFETSSFHLPRSHNISVIMVAAGTGLAPFRSFIRERLEQTRINSFKSARMLLFFGCRHEAEDFLYAEELLAARNADLLELHLAFSRDSPNEAKVYVQHRMLEAAGEIWHLLDECNAHFYVCGSAKTMSRDVRKCLLTVIETEGRRSPNQAEVYVKRLHADGRYHVDVWG